MSWAESAATGNVSTRWFHAFDAGRIVQCGAPGRGSARADEPERTMSSSGRNPPTTTIGLRISSRVPGTELIGKSAQASAGSATARPSRPALTLAFLALQRDRAAVLLHERTRDRETETCAGDRALRRVARTEEPREYLALLTRGNTDPRVRDDEADVTVARVDADDDRATLRCELHRVRDEVVDHLRESSRVSANEGWVICNELDRNFLLRSDRAQCLDGLGRELGKVEPLRLELDSVRFDLRDEQQLLHELVQPRGAATDHIQVCSPTLAEPVLFVLQHLEKP